MNVAVVADPLPASTADPLPRPADRRGRAIDEWYDTGHRATVALHLAIDRGAYAVHRVSDRLHEGCDRIVLTAGTAWTRAAPRVQAHPRAALLMAFASGLLVGLASRR